MLPLAPSVAGSGDNHVILADHIAAIRAAGGHGLRTVLLAGGIHNVAFQSLRIMRRGGQLSSEGGVCGDGCCGGIVIPSIAVVAGSIGSLSGQSRYRSGALALFHSLGAQRSAVLGHIVNGVRLGLRSRCLHGALDGTNGGTLTPRLTGQGVQIRNIRTESIVRNTTILSTLKVQQVIADGSTGLYFETDGADVQTIDHGTGIRITNAGSLANPTSHSRVVVVGIQRVTKGNICIGGAQSRSIVSHIGFPI